MTVILAVVVPGLVGIPLITPVDALIDNPAGRPLANHEYGVAPPLALTVALYAEFTAPDGNVVVVIATGVGGVMVIQRLVVAASCGLEESRTVTEAVLVPADIGVPLITPEIELIDNPAGSPVADQV